MRLPCCYTYNAVSECANGVCTMSYNRSTIMKAAWAYAHAEISAARLPLSGRSRRYVFKHALRRAWAEARMDRAAAMQSPRVGELCHALTALDGKNRWSLADYRRSAELNAALHAEHRIAA